MQNIPSAYVDGYARGQAVDPERAANYVAHTTIGDPLADAMVADLRSLEQEEQAKLIRLGLEGSEGGGVARCTGVGQKILRFIRRTARLG